MIMFTYERNNKNYELPYNPELHGFMYFHCKCSFVKFKKVEGNLETALSFYVEKRKIQVDVLEKYSGGTKHISSNTIHAYPDNQEELTKILSDNGLI